MKVIAPIQPDPNISGPRSTQMQRVPELMLEACHAASLQIGGPQLERLGVTSSLRGEGRTSIAIVMAMVQYEDYGRQAVLLDMDLDNPTLARRLGADPWPGLSELVRGEVSLQQVIQPVAEGISFVAAGAPSDSPARIMTELLRSGLIAHIGREAGVVIADLPSMLGSSAGPAAAGGFGDLLLVVRAGVTPVARIKEAVAGLSSPPPVLLNGTHSHLPPWVKRLIGT